MNVSIELSPAIEEQLREAAVKHNFDVQEFASRAVQELISKVGWAAENKADFERMLEGLAARMQANREQVRATQIEKNQAAIALLNAWRIEDASADKQEKAAREAEGKALEQGLAAHPFTLDEWTQ